MLSWNAEANTSNSDGRGASNASLGRGDGAVRQTGLTIRNGSGRKLVSWSCSGAPYRVILLMKASEPPVNLGKVGQKNDCACTGPACPEQTPQVAEICAEAAQIDLAGAVLRGAD
jgi:hypothetical protein